MKSPSRKTVWIAIALLLLAGGFFYLLERKKIQMAFSAGEGPVFRTGPWPYVLSFLRSPRETIRRYRLLSEAKKQWCTPIEFHGRVVDESEAGIPSARILFVWTDLSKEGHSTHVTSSDPGGLFALSGVRGKHLSVTVECDGYYTSKSNVTGFTYSGENINFTPKSSEPVIFRLQKKGSAEPLIIAKRKAFAVPRNGTPVDIDLIKRKAVPSGSGHLRVECWTNDESGEQRYDWRCRISVPGGGLIQSKTEFDFIAADNGYAPYDEINMPAALDNSWKSDIERRYFFKLPNSRYGRVTFAMIAGGDHFCMIEGFINPSGSRNLEYDPAVQPKPAFFE